MAQIVKNLPAILETQVQSLGEDDPWEKGMATHSSILAWRIPWTEEPGRLQAMRSQRVAHDWAHMRERSIARARCKGVLLLTLLIILIKGRVCSCVTWKLNKRKSLQKPGKSCTYM